MSDPQPTLPPPTLPQPAAPPVRSSSNRLPPPTCDATIARDRVCVGSVRLPVTRSDEFIDQFNRIYASIGIELSDCRTITIRDDDFR